jgi:two-component system chemotaxis sensor kinase CheA
MAQTPETLIARIDDLLNRAACELVLGPADGSSAPAALGALETALAGAADPALRALSKLVTESMSADASALAVSLARIEATWNAWKGMRVADPEPEPVAESVEAPEQAPAVSTAAAAGQVAAEPAAAGDDELMMLAADPELAGMFIAEALDHLSSIEALVLQVEAQPGDTKLLNDVFRPFHTIKGNAGALGVTSVQELAHSVENLLDLGRAGKHHIGDAEVEVILTSVDLLTTMIQGLSTRLAGQPTRDVRSDCHALIAQVDALVSGDGMPQLETPSDVPSAACEPSPAAAVDTPAMPAAAAAVADGATAVRTGAKAAAVVDESRQTVKVDTRKLDNLVDIVGELVIVQSIIQEDPALQRLVDERLSRNLGQLKRITSDLQRNAMAMRMTPIRPTFQKMSRLVRDLSRKGGKNIDLVLAGEDTELDRKVVEDINDPLMHMVRNSVDHGIELPDVRRAKGKPAQARVSLSAYHEGGSIVIAIADDGAGLNTERIRAKAVAQGLIAEDAAMSAAEIHELIFRPGFSTAEKVTEISGRGVGMDVVRRNIEALRGRIEIHSTPGQGTTFLIKLPLTLAILEGLLLRTGAERFVLPTFCIRESLRPSPEQVHSFQGRRRVIQVRDSLLPMIHLAELFGEAGGVPEPWDATVVVIEDNGRCMALLVDELLGKQEVVIKSLGSAFANVRGVAGGAILGDGRIGLILDAGGLVSLMDKPLEQAA